MTKRRNRTDAPMNQHLIMKDGMAWIDPPEGVELRIDVEILLWAQFCTARIASDWTTVDLVQLAKVVALETDMRELKKDLNAEGYLVDDKPNKLVSVIDLMQKQQLSIIRSMNLNVRSSSPEVMAKAVDNAMKHQVSADSDMLLM